MERVCGVEECVDPHRLITHTQSERIERCVCVFTDNVSLAFRNKYKSGFMIYSSE